MKVYKGLSRQDIEAQYFLRGPDVDHFDVLNVLGDDASPLFSRALAFITG